jgi:hypothetical protein
MMQTESYFRTLRKQALPVTASGRPAFRGVGEGVEVAGGVAAGAVILDIAALRSKEVADDSPAFL